ncbi:protoporphyrinogen oxidase [soil metagenome]
MKVAVVGGGIAGLAAAYFVRRERPDVDVVVFEGSPSIGGKLALGELAGMTIDLGAESMLARRPEAVGLARAVGLGDSLVHPVTITAGIWTLGAIRSMPPTVMGVPSDLDALLATGIVAGMPEATPLLKEFDEDLDVAQFVRAMLPGAFGADVVDRLIEPLLGGVYAGHASKLSLRAAAPQIAALWPDLLAAAAEVRQTVDPTPVFAGITGGVGRLPQAVADASGAEVRVNATVRQIEHANDVWRLVVGPTTDFETIEVDAVIVAAPAPAAARLLAVEAADAAFELAAIDYASMALVSLALPAEGFARPVAGSGFLVPPIDGKQIKASTFSSQKWGWVADAAPADTVVVRCSLGRAGETAVLQQDDAELIRLALADLSEATGFSGLPLDAHVRRWGGGLPQYGVGHLDRVAAIEASIAQVKTLEVCGAAYRGVGIPAVIASAEGAARRLLEHLGE